MQTQHRHVAAILFSCLFAAQAGQLALTPVLTDVAAAFGVSTAAASQIRTVAAVVAAVVALCVGAAVGRVRLRSLLAMGVGLVAVGSISSCLAPSLALLAAGQAVVGAGSSVLVGAGVAAAAAWTDTAGRARVVAWALVGAPAAWVVAMPAIGAAATTGWRLGFAVPVLAAAAAAVALSKAPAGAAMRSSVGLRSFVGQPRLRGWAVGELLAYAAWSGVLVFAGALFVESYGTSPSTVGVALAAGAAAYIPGTFAAQRAPIQRSRPLLAAVSLLLAAIVVVFGVVRAGALQSALAFGALCFLSGARTFLGSAVGLDLAPGTGSPAMPVRAAAAQLGWIVGAGAGGAALSTGGYPALSTVLAVLFVAGALMHISGAAALRRLRRRPAIRPLHLRPEAARARAR